MFQMLGGLDSIPGQGTRSHMPQLKISQRRSCPGTVKYIIFFKKSKYRLNQSKVQTLGLLVAGWGGQGSRLLSGMVKKTI